MSKLTEKIFKAEEHYITSKYGKREPITTKYGTTSDFHHGTDYGTNLKKLPQYAVETGTILSTGNSNSCGNYIWIKYPRLNVKMCHYHLDSISIKKGQKVDNNTSLGYTGMTGMATGIHLHLGVYDLIKNSYVDPEEYAKKYEEPKEETQAELDNKFEIGDKVILNGYLYRDSYGSKRGIKKENYQGTITLRNLKGTKPYHIDKIGWVSKEDIKSIEIEEYITYVVKKGDSLWKLAQIYSTSVDELVKLNNIENKNLIKINQKLKIPI